MVTTNCSQCGGTFTPRPNRVCREPLCSRDCWRKWNASGAIARERPCEVCGVTFRPHSNSLVARGRGRFCSHVCSAKARQKERPKHGYKMRDYAMEHRAVVERVLRRKLPPKAVVHHVNEDPADNRPSNLVVCQGTRYHRILHTRMRVKAAGGDPNLDKICGHCGTVKPLSEFYVNHGRGVSPQARRTSYCLLCSRAVARVNTSARLRARGVPTRDEMVAARRAAKAA